MATPQNLRVMARHSPAFRTLAIALRADRWSLVDAGDAKMRADLIRYVPSHILIAPGQDRELAAAGLDLVESKLVDLRAAAEAKKAAAPIAADTKKPAKT